MKLFFNVKDHKKLLDQAVKDGIKHNEMILILTRRKMKGVSHAH